jgi:hypothetical protein
MAAIRCAVPGVELAFRTATGTVETGAVDDEERACSRWTPSAMSAPAIGTPTATSTPLRQRLGVR